MRIAIYRAPVREERHLLWVFRPEELAGRVCGWRCAMLLCMSGKRVASVWPHVLRNGQLQLLELQETQNHCSEEGKLRCSVDLATLARVSCGLRLYPWMFLPASIYFFTIRVHAEKYNAVVMTACSSWEHTYSLMSFWHLLLSFPPLTDVFAVIAECDPCRSGLLLIK